MFFYGQGYRGLNERYAKEIIQLLEEVHADGKNGIDSMIALPFHPLSPGPVRLQPFPAKSNFLAVSQLSSDIQIRRSCSGLKAGEIPDFVLGNHLLQPLPLFAKVG
jgi:hypothetical protein